MKILAIASLLSLSSVAMASFDFSFECVDQYDGSPVLSMEVSASGIGAFSFDQSYSMVPMQVASQYADYGSIFVSFAEKFSGDVRYQLYLNMASGDQWNGELKDERGDFTLVSCHDRLNMKPLK